MDHATRGTESVSREGRAEAKALAERITEQARGYHRDPAAGFAAGYHPRLTEFRSREIGAADPVRHEHTLHDWLEAIAERDLEGWDWEVLRTIGGYLEIRGRQG